MNDLNNKPQDSHKSDLLILSVEDGEPTAGLAEILYIKLMK